MEIKGRGEVDWPMTSSLLTPPPFLQPDPLEDHTDPEIGDDCLNWNNRRGPEPLPLSSTEGDKEEDKLTYSCLFCLSPAPEPDSVLKKKVKKTGPPTESKDSERTGRLALGHRELFAYLCKKSGLEPPRAALVSSRASYCSVCMEIHKELTTLYTQFQILKTELQTHVEKLVGRVVKSHLGDNSFVHFSYPGHGGFQRLRFRKTGNIPKKVSINSNGSKGLKRGRKRKVKVAETTAEPRSAAAVANPDETAETLHFSLSDVLEDYGFDSHGTDSEQGEEKDTNASIVEESKTPIQKLDEPVVFKAQKRQKVLEIIVNKKSKPRKKATGKNATEGEMHNLKKKERYSLKPCTVPLVRCDLPVIKIEPIESSIKVEEEEASDEVYEDPHSPDTFEPSLVGAPDTANSLTKLPQAAELEIIISNVESLNKTTGPTNMEAEEVRTATTTTDRRRSLRKRKTVIPSAALLFEGDSENDNEKDKDFVVEEEVSKARGRPRKHRPKSSNEELSSSLNQAKSTSNDKESGSESSSGTNESDEEDLMNELVANLGKRQKTIRPKRPGRSPSHGWTKKGSLACMLCPNYPVFISKYDRNSHLRQVHSEEMKTKCPECGKEVWKAQLIKHIRLSHENPSANKPLSCAKCDKKFAVKYLLEEHEEGHKIEKEMPLVCEICDMRFPIQINKAFKGEDVLKNHMRNKHMGRVGGERGDFNIKCEHCDWGKLFRKSTYAVHVARKHPEKCTHTCPTCSRRYPTDYVLKCHMILHSEGPTYACNICTFKMTSLEAMKEHFRSHYPLLHCKIDPQCVKVFGSVEERTRHNSLKHGQEKQFSCDVCKKKYANESDILVHKKRMHNPAFTSFKCDQCPPSAPLSFRSKQQLKTHISVVHEGVRFLCTYPNCNKELANRSCLADHLSRHKGGRPRPFKCTWEDCEYAFETRQKIQRHVDYVHLLKKNNVCDKCGTAFGPLSHLKVHMAYWCKAKPPNPERKTYRINKGKFKRLQPMFKPTKKCSKNGRTAKDLEEDDAEEC